MHVIYCAVCIAGGPDKINKKYIGRTQYIFADMRGQIVYPDQRSLTADQYTIAKVQKRHLEGARVHGNCVRFYNALRHHKLHQFCWGIIDTAETMEKATDKEEFYIRHHKTADRNYGYNIRIRHGDTREEGLV